MSDEADSTPSVGESLADRVARSVVYRLPGMEKVRVISDLKAKGLGHVPVLGSRFGPYADGK